MLGPVLEREAEARAGEFALVKIDVDANPELALRYQIYSSEKKDDRARAGNTAGSMPMSVIRST
jgi:hypothetical protein